MSKKNEKEQPRPRGNKRSRTRERLIEAAAAIIGDKGFEGASLEEIARRAGLTRGAFYNNFADKEELFLAVAEKLWEPGAPTVREGASLAELMNTIGRSVAATAERRRPLAVGALSFQAYALKNETMRRRLVEANAGIYKWAEKHLLAHVSAEKLPMPAGEFVRAVHALTEGFLALKFLTPELIDDETIVAAFEAMAGTH